MPRRLLCLSWVGTEGGMKEGRGGLVSVSCSLGRAQGRAQGMRVLWGRWRGGGRVYVSSHRSRAVRTPGREKEEMSPWRVCWWEEAPCWGPRFGATTTRLITCQTVHHTRCTLREKGKEGWCVTPEFTDACSLKEPHGVWTVSSLPGERNAQRQKAESKIAADRLTTDTTSRLR